MLLRNQPCPKCPSSDALQEYADGFFCHSCHTKFFSDSYNRKRYIAQDKPEPSVVCLPDDYTFTIPEIEPNIYNELCGKAWIDQYNITEEQRGSYLIGYSPSKKRIILPYYVDGTLVGYQSRRCDNDKRKYLTYGFKDCTFQSQKWRASTNKVVLCEDIISAIKIGEVAHSFALMTTSLKNQDEFKRMLKYITDEVYIWMDPDGPGQKATIKLEKSLRSLFRTHIIKSNKDPKYYSTDEIRGYLTNE